MFIYAFMTCRLHVLNMFDEMSVVVVMGISTLGLWVRTPTEQEQTTVRNVEIPTVDQHIMQYTKTQYNIYFYNTLQKLNRIEQDQENTYN